MASQEDAERGLLELVRLKGDAPNFSVAVACRRGRWSVRVDDLEGHGALVGDGDSFGEAWAHQVPQPNRPK